MALGSREAAKKAAQVNVTNLANPIRFVKDAKTIQVEARLSSNEKGPATR